MLDGLGEALKGLLEGLGYIALAIIFILVILAFICGVGAGVFLKP